MRRRREGKRYRPYAFGVAAGAIALVFATATLGATSRTPVNLVVNVAVAPASLDPATTSNPTDIMMALNLYTRLTQFGTKPGPNGTVVEDHQKILPYAAASWKTSDGATTYTFTLRKGMKFPGGRPVNAAAVKYSLERTLAINVAGGFFINDGFVSPPLISSVEAPNSRTVVIHLSRPDANALQAWSTAPASIVDPAIVEANGGVVKSTLNQYMISHVAGAGPFLLKSYQPNQSAVLVRNPDAIDPPAADKLTINFVNSDPTLLLLARSGKADATIGMSLKDMPSLKANKLVRLAVNDSEQVEQVGLTNTLAPFNNQLFREAMTYAVPYSAIVKQIAGGYGRLFYGPIPPILPQYKAKLEKPRTYDLKKAKALIQASGVSVPVSVNMAIQEGNETDLQIATVLQADWSQLGVNVNPIILAPAAYSTAVRAHTYQSYVRLDGPAVLDAGYFLGYDMTCGQAGNRTAMCIPQADKLLDKARKTQDPVTRQKQYDAITRLWVADSPKIMVYQSRIVTVLSKHLKGFVYSHYPDFRNWTK